MRKCASKMDGQLSLLCNNIRVRLKGTSPSATQAKGRYVIRDVTSYTLRVATEHRTAWNSPYILQELDVDVGC
jgi:hypothetical protein